MTLAWIARRLERGTKTHLSHLLYWQGRAKEELMILRPDPFIKKRHIALLLTAMLLLAGCISILVPCPPRGRFVEPHVLTGTISYYELKDGTMYFVTPPRLPVTNGTYKRSNAAWELNTTDGSTLVIRCNVYSMCIESTNGWRQRYYRYNWLSIFLYSNFGK
jgi:hypothetical protein